MARRTPADLQLDIDDVDQRLADGFNLPSHCYTDSAVFDFEMDAIFANCWQYFAPAHRAIEPGSVVTGTVGRTPVAVVRGDDGELRGFVNACRHRGYQVVGDDKSECARMQCGYHGWIYNLDGSLARMGRGEGDLTIVKDDFGLHPVSVELFGQGIFVNPKPDAESMFSVHGELAEVANKIGLDPDLERYVPFARYEVEQRSNWKLWYDNGTECFHCPTVHGESFGAAYDVSDGFYDVGLHGTFYSAGFESTRRSEAQLVGGNYRSVQIYPGTQYIQQDDIMIMGRVIPTSASTCVFQADYLAEQGADPDRVEEWAKLWNQTYDEDGEIVEAIQRNLESGRVTEMRYVDGLEDASRFFHDLVWQSYKAALSPDSTS